jgi:hypothetical protein
MAEFSWRRLLLTRASVTFFTPISPTPHIYFPIPKVALNPEPSTNPPSLLLTKAELAIRKAQQALDKTERLEQQAVAKELCSEFERPGKIHKKVHETTEHILSTSTSISTRQGSYMYL